MKLLRLSPPLLVTLLAATCWLTTGCDTAEGAAAGVNGTGGTTGAAGSTAAGGGISAAGTTGGDNVPASAVPPGELTPDQVPMFVTIGFDDNPYSGLEGSDGEGGVQWALDLAAARTNPAGSGNAGTYDGTPALLSFYLATKYIAGGTEAVFLKRALNAALVTGHEIGNHTHAHSHGSAFTADQWAAEIESCTDWLTKPFDPNEPDSAANPDNGVGMPASEIFGFRTPFLEYSDALFATLKDLGFWYDCSIEDGWQSTHDGTNYNWPYTLDSGSPGNQVLVGWGLRDSITGVAGLWEMPAHPVVVPPDDRSAEYGIDSGLRAKLAAAVDYFDTADAKVTGLDYNLWYEFGMTKAELLATLKHTLDLRLEGNRAPMMFGAHTDYYSTKYAQSGNATVTERQEAIEEFLDYALTHADVRVVSIKQILDWVRNPVPL